MGDTNCRKIGFSDPEAMPLQRMAKNSNTPYFKFLDRKDSQLYGFGFSYVWYRELSIETPFNDMSWSEDYTFILQLRKLGHVELHYDLTGICLHLLHPNATSCSYPGWEISEEKSMSLEVAVHYP